MNGTVRNLSILLAEDDALARDILTELLVGQGHSVHAFDDGGPAVEAFTKGMRFDMVISDMLMPGMSGMELLRNIRDLDADVPIIILTGNQEVKVAMEAVRSGADDYVIKGENVEEDLALSIQRVMEKFMLKAQNRKLLHDLAIKNDELAMANQKLEDIVAKLTHIGVSMMSEENLLMLLDKIVTEARAITHADGGTLYLLEDGRLHYRIIQNESLGISLGGESVASDKYPSVAIEEAHVSGYVAINKRPLLIADVYESEDFDFSGPRKFDAQRGYKTRSLLVVPLLNKEEEVTGVLQLVNATDPASGNLVEFDPRLLDIVHSLACQASVAIENYRLHEARIRQEKTRNDFGLFYIVTIIIFAVGNALPDISNLTGIKRMLASWGMVLALSAPLLYFIRRVGLPLSEFGVTMRGWRKSVGEGLAISLMVAPVMIFLKLFIGPAGEPLFSWKLTNHYAPWEFNLKFGLYFFHSYVQEFSTRGVIQSSLLMFLNQFPPLVPIFIVSLMFGISHLHISYLAAALTSVVSFLFGYIYYRHRNLLGVATIHYLLGVLAMALGWV